MAYRIYYDSLQEGLWFQSLHPALQEAELFIFPSKTRCPELLRPVLAYDRPDIVLCDNGNPILVVERTIEVPSGHNVGQRFSRLVAAAQQKVPVVYFGPYAAYKHGGATQGPRYMNLRLFYALDKMAEIEDAAITLINWPVDNDYEIINTAEKDVRMIEYLQLFFNAYTEDGLANITNAIMTSTFERNQEDERTQFIREQVQNPEQYDDPPSSVIIAHVNDIQILQRYHPLNLTNSHMVIYKVGMRYIRSDPYCGMAMLYSYLYCDGLTERTRDLILHFPQITREMWYTAARRASRKDIRIFRLTADGILFSDGYIPKDNL